MVSEWFDERVRPAVRFLEEGTWGGACDLPSDEQIASVLEALAAADGAPPRTVYTVLAGWRAGFVASVVAFGVVRDGVVVRAARPGVLEVLRHDDGWLGDARLARPAVAVGVRHPWAGHPGVEVVDDVLADALEEVRRACGPLVELLAGRSGRGRLGLWAQVSDAVGLGAERLLELDPALDPVATLAAFRRLLEHADAPWRQTPAQWFAGDVLVTHRGGCCLYYQCDGPAGEHCATCLHRSPAEVEASVTPSARSA